MMVDVNRIMDSSIYCTTEKEAKSCVYCGEYAVANADAITWGTSQDLCKRHLQHVMDGSCGTAVVEFFTGERIVIKR